MVYFLLGAAAIGFLAGGATTFASRSPAHAAAVQTEQHVAEDVAPEHEAEPAGETVSGCSALDGDTLRCGRENVRLVGIDSPAMPGQCPEGRTCEEGDPLAAQAALSGSVSPAMPIRRLGTDPDGNTFALVEGPLGDLSCSQLRAGHAAYRAQWDIDGTVRKECRLVLPEKQS